jgi:hypothetical protein
MIHTNAGILGTSIAVANCSFFPNGGTFQPGCPVETKPQCDHARSWHYYAESVRAKEPIFDAIKCNNYLEFKLFNCSFDPPLSNMGYHASLECNGNYYLQTNEKFPFSRGIFGLQFYPFDDTDRQTEDKHLN